MARPFDVRRLPGFGVVALATFVLLYLPILVLVVFSFNAGTSQSQWEGFSLQWYAAAFANQQVQDVSIRSLWLAGVAADLTSQDVPAILATWSGVVPADRIHVVTVPPPGSPRGAPSPGRGVTRRRSRSSAPDRFPSASSSTARRSGSRSSRPPPSSISCVIGSI